MNTDSFKALGLNRTLSAIARKGFSEPSPVQAMAIPLLLSGKEDIVAQARTGTGKTAAFALPLIEMIEPRAGHVQAIVLAPTRELALQVCDEINALKGDNSLSVAPVYGGQSMGEQFRRLRAGVDIVVGTPGRIMDHMRRGSLSLSQIRYVILDEADEMLDMGFVEDIETILASAHGDRRMLLFSATMSPRIMKIAEKYMREFKTVKATTGETTTRLTEQIVIEIEERDRFEALCRTIDINDEFYGIVFCRTRSDVDDISQKLVRRGYEAEALHGDVSQAQREKILSKMRTRELSILVATDVAARGIDISGLTHVVNYELPQDPEAYIHRIGRTGRAGKNGTAVTFVNYTEFRKLGFIKRIAGTEIKRAQLPSVQQLIESKKKRISERIASVIDCDSHQSCREMAQKLLESADSLDLVTALLSLSHGKELDASLYAEISEPKPRRDEHRGGGGYRSKDNHRSNGFKPRQGWKDKKSYGSSGASSHSNSRKPANARSKRAS